MVQTTTWPAAAPARCWHRRILRMAVSVGLLCSTLEGWAAGPGAGGEPGAAAQPFETVSNLAQVRQLSAAPVATNLPVDLAGVVGGLFPELSLVVLHDDNGNAGLKLDLQRFPFLKLRQRVRIVGLGRFGSGEASLLPAELIDNDGTHPAREVSGRMYLTKGLHPFGVNFFQAVRQQALKIEYEGPGIRLMPPPATALFHAANPAEPEARCEPGLNLDYYEGVWDGVPDFRQMEPVTSGIAGTISLALRRREENYALRFSGLLKIDQAGEYVFHLTSDDGSQLFVQEVATSVKILAENEPEPTGPAKPLELGQALPQGEDYFRASCEGKVSFIGRTGKGWNLEMHSDGTQVKVVLNQADTLPSGLVNDCLIRVTGFCEGVLDEQGRRIPGTLLVSRPEDISVLEAASAIRSSQPGTTAPLPVLTSADQIRRLKPEEAARSYPVRLRGTITARQTVPEGIIQDLTAAVYVRFNSLPKGRQVAAGNFCELTGVTAPGGYATLVIASGVTDLGRGRFPTPLHPDYAQILGGSLDCQWVELQGMISHFDREAREAQLVVKGGKVRTFFIFNADLGFVEALSNAFVRIRGCVVPGKNVSGQPVREAGLWVPSSSCIAVDQAAPADPFEASLKQISEFSKFDPNPNYYQMTKVRGQILHLADQIVYFTDDTDVLRILPQSLTALAAGDLVEAVGLPEAGPASPSLIEASIRKIGQARLPAPPPVDFEQLAQPEYDAHWVRIEGRLIEIRTGPNQVVLDLQSGLRNIQAVAPTNLPKAALPPAGSRISVCGVVAQSPNGKYGNTGVAELLFNSLSDITCLELPPFWTQRRALWAVEGLVSAVSLAGLWIYFLRRTVSTRTRALQLEMNERQSAEEKVRGLQTQRALEEQRARIARNIHDDLGARATKLSLLAHRHPVSAAEVQAHFDNISATSRQIVEALDETVWAVNPANDSLLRLANYMIHYAQDFFQNTGIHCRLDIPTDLPELSVTAEFRFNLFLLVKEALNNVLKHSGAQTVLLQMRTVAGQLQLTIQDDGRGFHPDSVARRSGLANLQTRVAGLGGQITLASAPGSGTRILITVPLIDTPLKPAQ